MHGDPIFFNQNVLAFITNDIFWNFENNLMLSFAIMPFWRGLGFMFPIKPIKNSENFKITVRNKMNGDPLFLFAHFNMNTKLLKISHSKEILMLESNTPSHLNCNHSN